MKDEQGSDSSDTTFASLKADSETYASVDSFAANRYSHWDYLKPPPHLVDDSQSEFDNVSEHSTSTDANKSSDVEPQIEKMTKLMEQGSVFELPRMTSTPTPYSPILRHDVKTTPIEEEEEEQTVVDESGDETLEVEVEEVQKPSDNQKEPEPELRKESPVKVSSPEVKEPEEIIAQFSRSPTSLRPRLAIVTARTRLPSVPSKPELIPSTVTQSLATSIKKRERQKSSKAVDRKVSNAPKRSVVTKIDLKPPEAVKIVSASGSSKPAFPVAQSNASDVARPSRLRKVAITALVPPPLPQVENEKDVGKLTISSVTEINIEKIPESSDVLKGMAATSKLQSENVTEKKATLEVEDKNSRVTWAKEEEVVSAEVEQFSDQKSDDSSIRVVVKRGRRKSESPDKQLEQLNNTIDESQTDFDKSFNTEYQKLFRAAKSGKGDSSLSWVEQKLVKHEMKQRLMNQRCQSVKNKKYQDMIKQLKMKQELNVKGTSADAFARIFIDNFMSSWLKFELPLYSEEDFHDFIQNHSSDFAKAVSQYGTAESNAVNKMDRPSVNFRVPSLRNGEDRVVSVTANEMTESSLLVDVSGIFSLDDSSVFGLDSSRPTSTGLAHRRSLSRKCKSAFNDAKHRNVKEDRPKTAFPQPQVVLRQRSDEKFKSGSAPLSRVQTSHLNTDGTASKSSKHVEVSIAPRSIPSKCTDYVLVKAQKMSSFDNPSKVERRLLAARFPNIYEQAVGALPGLYSVTGNLTDCYDELGNRYQLPVYLLSNPINFIDESSSAIEGHDTTLADLATMKPEEMGKEVSYRVRISSKHDDYFDITLREKSYVYHGKMAVCKQFKIDIRGQRWFYAGKVLLDTVKLKDYKIAADCIIQVIDISKKELAAKEEKDVVTIEINNMQDDVAGDSKEGGSCDNSTAVGVTGDGGEAGKLSVQVAPSRDHGVRGSEDIGMTDTIVPSAAPADSPSSAANGDESLLKQTSNVDKC